MSADAAWVADMPAGYDPGVVRGTPLRAGPARRGDLAAVVRAVAAHMRCGRHSTGGGDSDAGRPARRWAC